MCAQPLLVRAVCRGDEALVRHILAQPHCAVNAPDEVCLNCMTPFSLYDANYSGE